MVLRFFLCFISLSSEDVSKTPVCGLLGLSTFPMGLALIRPTAAYGPENYSRCVESPAGPRKSQNTLQTVADY
jgi:hypothetical protein